MFPPRRHRPAEHADEAFRSPPPPSPSRCSVTHERLVRTGDSTRQMLHTAGSPGSVPQMWYPAPLLCWSLNASFIQTVISYPCGRVKSEIKLDEARR